jgi:tRNA threonylcarbamoyladenosine biosynthesis protein TsaB
MTWLAVDTSTTWLSAALWRTDGVVSEQRALLDREMLQSTPAVVQNMLQQADIAIHELTGLAVGIGPGSYTGVRVGMSFMQGLALALSVPLYGIKTSAAIAAAFPGSLRLCIMQESGRRTGHVIVSVYDTTTFPPEELTSPTIILPADITNAVDFRGTVVGGPAAVRVAQISDVTFNLHAEMTAEEAVIPRGRLVAKLGYQQHQTGDPGDPRLIDGVYLTVPPIPHGKRNGD